MNFRKFFSENGKNIVIYLILWLFVAIVFVPSLTYCTAAATMTGHFDFEKFLEVAPKAFSHPFKSFNAIMAAKMMGKYFINLIFTTMILGIFFIIGMFRYKSRNKFRDVEHGSSDWSVGGEQFKILSNKKGIILAEGNYLPVDKVGNVNVLVVGRIRFW